MRTVNKSKKEEKETVIYFDKWRKDPSLLGKSLMTRHQQLELFDRPALEGKHF